MGNLNVKSIFLNDTPVSQNDKIIFQNKAVLGFILPNKIWLFTSIIIYSDSRMGEIERIDYK